MNTPIINVKGTRQYFEAPSSTLFRKNIIRALDGVDIEIFGDKTLAIVGESGSGKSTLAKQLLMLLKPTEGDLYYQGVRYRDMGRNDKLSFRRNVQAVFQDPASSLNPSMTVEKSLGSIVRHHRLTNRNGQREFIAAQLASVGLDPPSAFLDRYPHQLSGGQQQRVAIARAMMLSPKLVVADEPLSSLDISVQAQVLELMVGLRERTGVGFVIISHDLGAMKMIADQVAVMYSGRIVELGSNVFDSPRHPYTKLLLDSQLSMDPRNRRCIATESNNVEKSIAGSLPATGCAFRNRCKLAEAVCASEVPKLLPTGKNSSTVACHLTRQSELTGNEND
jgi:oligopeptide/dipeptide ABC transporter ATP-binding protein